MTPFTREVIAVIRRIPPGHVMTYGQIAALAGSPRGARQVVRILHAMSRAHKLPWHRVINAKGDIAFADDVARAMQQTALEEEGVEVSSNGSIDLDRYRYVPGEEDIDGDKQRFNEFA